MKNLLVSDILRLTGLSLLSLLSLFACDQPAAEVESSEEIFAKLNEAHHGDYLATYPLTSPDSCLARLKAEVPEPMQPWCCLSLWYRLPRTNPVVNFRLLELYEENYPHDTVTAFAQMVRGEFYVDLLKFDSARICLEDAYDRYMRLGRPLDASDATYLMARSYVYQNNFADALDAYFQVLDLLDKTDTSFSHRRAYLYGDISAAYERSDNHPQEYYWLKKRWDADHSGLVNAWRYRISTATRLSVYYHSVNPDSSLIWAKKAIDIFSENNEGAELPARLTYWLARAYYVQGACATALPHFQDAYRRNPEKHKPIGYYQYSLSLGDCFSCVGQLDSAEVYLKESLSTPDTGNLAAAYRYLGDVYAKKGDWKSAFDAATESQRLYKIKFTADKAKAVADSEARYETSKKEHRIAELEQAQQINRQRNQITGMGVLILLGLACSLFFRQRGRHRILAQEKELLAQEKELIEARELLKSQELALSRANLATTQKELNNTTRLLMLKSQLIEELEMKLSNRETSAGDDDANNKTNFSNLYGMKILTDTDWVLFQQRFEENFPRFLLRVRTEFPNFTEAEKRLFLLIKLDFNKKEIAETLGISPDSVYRGRNRLSKKMGLQGTGNLDDFIREFE